MLALPYALAVLTVLLAALAGVAYATRLHRRGVRINQQFRTRDLPLIPITLLLFIAVMAAANLATRYPNYMWQMPLVIDYYYRPIFWVLKLAFVTFPLTAITALAILNRHPRRALIALFAIAAVVAVEIQLRYVHRPKLGPLVDTRTHDGIIRQSNAATCAAAASANIARILGHNLTEADMVRIMHTSWEGTSPAQLVYGFRALNLDARKVSSPTRDILSIAPPAIILVDVGGEPDAHAVAYIRRDGDRYEIWNPNSGRVFMTADEIKASWRGHAIEVRPR